MKSIINNDKADLERNTQDLERFESEMREDNHAFYRFGGNLMKIKAQGKPGYEKEIELWEKLMEEKP